MDEITNWVLGTLNSMLTKTLGVFYIEKNNRYNVPGNNIILS